MRILKLPENALKIVDNKQDPRASIDDLRADYNIPAIDVRQDKHICSLMYRLSKKHELIHHHRPRVQL